MPRPRNAVPSLLKGSRGDWRVVIDGREYSCGRATDPKVKVQAEYARLIARHAANPSMGKRLRVGTSMAALTEDFLRSDESPAGISHRGKYAMLPDLFREALGELNADEYDGERHREFKAWLVGSKRYCRWSVNEWLMRVRRLVKYGQSRKMVPAEHVLEVCGVTGVRVGDARESEKVSPAVLADVEATIPNLPPALRTLVRVQLLCGARAGELVGMRPYDIDRSATPWAYRPAKHKGQWRGNERVIFLGPKARKALADPIEEAGERGFVFPTPGRERHYLRTSYQHAIRDACIAAGVPHWTSHQLRHRCGTLVREKFGKDYAAAVLGHSGRGVTDRYTWAETAKRLAAEAAEKLG